ncbi:cation diffusion facilitator family transporter [Gordonia paraffinivorans]|uniref:Ferrous-iron efflux pump FieF n=1 Tax=Gordonia paraffinivorans TaxID=175628 RepID=A0ABD7V133_9ACTN|nr:cation diffusion facilitator family transporter [Gordonia paraffinivorans]MCD2143921.1 cation diffusion facilitator family transporter [Gordonia paraffinivorans]VFA83145.1 Ferrous-iron efflux pump FieF [Gordonia paraffinivorans]
MKAEPRDLTRFALLSIVTAVAVFALKVVAWWVTGSVGLLSDALESIVNVVAAVAAFAALRVAAKPPDSGHNFGHTKAEYFSAVFEGVLIVVAAVIIVVSAVDRLLHPRELESVGLGLGISIAATVLNGAVGLFLIAVGRRHRSLTLEADGKHLMTDVATTIGVVIAVFLVAWTGWLPLDPIIAIAVAVNIMVVGFGLVKRSGAGLMDSALPDEQLEAIEAVLDRHRADGIVFHDIRTREAGHQRFVQLHMLVPGDWSVQRAHDLAEEVEGELHDAVADLSITTHIEPVGDPRAYEEWRLD